MVETRGERERDLERLLTFVDAVVAIAITLLVLPLVDIANQLDGGSVLHLLKEHEAQLAGFFLSFVVIAQLWFSQHRVLRNVIAQDAVVVRLMMTWLLTIVVLPFPTALVAQQGHQSATKVLYMGTMALSAACLTAMSWRIGRTPQIRDSDDVPDPLAGALTMFVFVVALLVSLVLPWASYWPLLLLLLTDNVLRAVRRHRPVATT